MKFIDITRNKVYKNIHFKNFKDFFVGGIIAILVGYLGNYLINKSLSKEDLGLFSYYFNIMTLLSGVFSLGVYHAYLRFNNKEKLRFSLKNIVLKFSILSSIALFFISYLIFQNIYISVFSFFILFNERIYLFRSVKKILKMNVLKCISSIILMLSLICFVNFSKLTFDKALFSYGVGYFVVFVLGLLIDKKSEKFNNIKNANEFNLKSILEYTTPIALSTMLTWILAVSDQIILKEFVSFSDLGNYAIGYRVIVVIKIFTSLFLLYYPILYFEEADKNRFNAINKIRFLFIVMLVFVTVVLVLFRRYIYILMGADQYLDFTHIFSLLVVAELLRIISGFFLTFRAYTLQTWYTMIIVGMSAVISIILNLIFIPSFGIISAAYIQVAVSIIYLIATYFLAIKPEKKFFKNEIKYN